MLPAAVALSICGLLVGPSIGAWARGKGTALAALDAATLALVPGVVLLRLLPHLVADAGALAFACFGAGYLGLQLLEARSHRSSAALGLAIVLPTLIVHSFVDGAALGVALGGDREASGGAMLVLALLLHRIPEGMFFASAMAGVGARRTRGAIAAVAIATVLGSLAGRELIDHAPHEVLHLIVALGLGVMLRLVVHRHDDSPADGGASAIGGVTFVACTVAIVAIPTPEHVFSTAQPHELAVIRGIVPLFLETAPMVLALIATAELVARVRRAPPQEADPVALPALLCSRLLGPWFAAVRGVLVPAVAGLVARGTEASRRLHWPGSVLAPARRVLPSYCLGVILALAAEAGLPAGCLGGWDVLVLPAAAMFAALVWHGGSGAPLLAAVLLHKGASVASVAAYVIAGAAQAILVPRRPVLQIALVTAACGVALALAPVLSDFPGPPLHELGHHVHAWIEWSCAAALAAWIAFELARVGPRTWLR